MVAVGQTEVLVDLAPPVALEAYREHAELVEDYSFGDHRWESGYAFVGVSDDGGEWPRLVVTQRFAPAGAGFAPGVLLVPELAQVFIGAGTRLLAYQARSGPWRRCWEDEAELGFWAWRRHGDVVVMSAELELAAWSVTGTKLWTTFVEPPWSYQVIGGQVRLDVMGTVSTFDLASGR